MDKTRNKLVQVHVPYHALLLRLEELASYGINPEIYFDASSIVSAGEAELRRVREAFEARGLRITMHGPFTDLGPGALDEVIREASLTRYRQALKVASILRPATIVLHASYDERAFDKRKDLWLRQSLKTWPSIAKEAALIGTTIALENIFEKTPDTLKTLVQQVGSPHLGVCLDTGHLNVFSEATMEEWFSEVGPYLAETHIHDNDGTFDSHLPVGEGTVDFGLFFSLLDRCPREPVLTIEPHGDETMRRAILAIKKYV